MRMHQGYKTRPLFCCYGVEIKNGIGECELRDGDLEWEDWKARMRADGTGSLERRPFLASWPNSQASEFDRPGVPEPRGKFVLLESFQIRGGEVPEREKKCVVSLPTFPIFHRIKCSFSNYSNISIGTWSGGRECWNVDLTRTCRNL